MDLQSQAFQSKFLIRNQSNLLENYSTKTLEQRNINSSNILLEASEIPSYSYSSKTFEKDDSKTHMGFLLHNSKNKLENMMIPL